MFNYVESVWMRPEGFKRMFSVTYFPFNDIVIIIFLNFWFEISSPFLVNPADMISAGEWLFLSREQWKQFSLLWEISVRKHNLKQVKVTRQMQGPIPVI